MLKAILGLAASRGTVEEARFCRRHFRTVALASRTRRAVVLTCPGLPAVTKNRDNTGENEHGEIMVTNPVNLQSINAQNQNFWLEQTELLLR